MELPDVIGYKLDEAIDLINDKGYIVDSVVITKSLKATEPTGIARIVRLLPVGETRLEVVVAYQGF